MLKTAVKKEKLIAARDIMARYKLTYQTINHYTNLGLLPMEYKKGNVRFYDENVIRHRVALITRLTREGYSLRLIRKKLSGVKVR